MLHLHGKFESHYMQLGKYKQKRIQVLKERVCQSHLLSYQAPEEYCSVCLSAVAVPSAAIFSFIQCSSALCANIW